MRIAATVTRLVRRLLDVTLLLVIAAVLGAVIVARVVPWLTGGTTLVVTGGSMVPAIPVGAAVIATPVDPSTLVVGDVVSVRVGPAQSIFTHRIVRFAELPEGPHLETKGDANATVDPTLLPLTAVIGRADTVIPVVGYLITLLAEPQGIVFVLGVAGLLLAATWLVETLELDQRATARRASMARERAVLRDAWAAAIAGGPAAMRRAPIPDFLDPADFAGRPPADFAPPPATGTLAAPSALADHERAAGEPISRRVPTVAGGTVDASGGDAGRGSGAGPRARGSRRAARTPRGPVLAADETLSDRIAGVRETRGRRTRWAAEHGRGGA